MKDPVCGMPVDPSTPFRASHDGTDYYFCSALCREAFLAGPAETLRRQVPSAAAENRPARRVAYLTMEIALDPRMATYSGGLGVLAGDTVRAAADLGVPLVAVTLLYRDGYLAQSIDSVAGQQEAPERWPFGQFLQPLAETAEVAIEGRAVRVRAWRYEVLGAAGQKVPVLFLDTELPENDPLDRALCGRLYSGDERYRLAQEIVLGVGSVRILEALGYVGIERFHMNEGHAALAPLELARRLNAGRPDLDWRLDDVRRRSVFTTHTPVTAGHDSFSWDLAERVLGGLVPRRMLEMLGGNGRMDMTSLALNLSGYVNGVARKHAEVSRQMHPGYGIHHITNGVHSKTWTAPAFQAVFDSHLPGWDADPSMLRNAIGLPSADLWQAHVASKNELMEAVRRSTGVSLDPGTLTIGFARRATQYKRADLIFDDLPRLRKIAAKGPFQLVFGGKAHQRDEDGKRIIRRVLEVGRELGREIPVVYLPNYDTALARTMVAGADVWLNTPQRPLEASGTSGMKAAHNGVPSLSVLDGWWIEGCVEGVTGWAIGDLRSASDAGEDRRREAQDLFAKLEGLVLPAFYGERERWVTIMRFAISLNASFFNTHRMLQQYATNAYI
jgi:starch phosphorylase